MQIHMVLWQRGWSRRTRDLSRDLSRFSFLVYFLHFAWSAAEAKCILVMAVCVSVPCHIPTLLQRPGCRLRNGSECPVVVHYWMDLQSVHGFRCYDNTAPNAKCQWVLVLALCLIFLIFFSVLFYCILRLVHSLHRWFDFDDPCMCHRMCFHTGVMLCGGRQTQPLVIHCCELSPMLGVISSTQFNRHVTDELEKSLELWVMFS